jgi:hypothetical protein
MTTTESTTESTTTTLSGERTDLLDTLAKSRFFLRFTTRDLTDEQAALRPTASGLCLGGLIKHVTGGERSWVDFILDGPAAPVGDVEGSYEKHAQSFQMLPGETLSVLLAEYEAVARRTDEVVATLPDLDMSHPLPEAPWFEPGARWSARRVIVHIIAETTQHSGHADIIRETIDGAKTMG